MAPADMFVDDEFFGLFHQFPGVLAASQAELVLLGTRPAHPSDQYGYIVPGNEAGGAYFPVKRFEEKPGISRAQQLIQENALWNCGVFAFPLRCMLAHLEQMGLPIEVTAFTARYPGLPVRSFDQEIAERSSKAVVLRHEGEWRDLGSWESLTAQLRRPVVGLGGIWGECAGTHIVNELKIPLHVIGVSGIVAVGSPEGILIAGKREANAIKEILKDASGIPLYAETDWGSYSILDRSISGTTEVLTLKLSLLPDHVTPELPCRSWRKSWIVLSGHGEVILNGSAAAAQAGQVFTILPGDTHAVKAFTAMELIEVRLGGEQKDEIFYSDC